MLQICIYYRCWPNTAVEKKALPLFLITLQHMAFEEYLEGTSSSNRREWAKVQGRFDDIPFSNSPQQTWELVSNSLDPKPKLAVNLEIWSKNQRKQLVKITSKSIPSISQISKCYPLHPTLASCLTGIVY